MDSADGLSRRKRSLRCSSLSLVLLVKHVTASASQHRCACVCVFVLLLCLQSNDPSASQPSPFPNSRRFWLHARFLNAFFSLSFCFRVFKVGVLARSLCEVVPSMSCPFFLSWFVCSLSMRGAHLLSEL